MGLISFFHPGEQIFYKGTNITDVIDEAKYSGNGWLYKLKSQQGCWHPEVRFEKLNRGKITNHSDKPE